MRRNHLLLALASLLFCSITWAAAPMPVVSGDTLTWAVVSARTINVHRGDGSYIVSLPGSETSWSAPESGDYFLVAANERHWREWPRSDTVTVEVGVTGGAPMPSVDGATLHWPSVAGGSINVHRGDGTYIESLPSGATSWTAPEPGDYFLVATSKRHWQFWPRSETVTVDDTTGDLSPVTGLRADVYSKTAAELFWDRPAASGLQYEIARDGVVLESTDGVSYFDDSLSANTLYSYQVTAIDQAGKRSVPISITVQTDPDNPDGDGTLDAINANNFVNIVAHVFDIYVGEMFSRPLLELESFPFTETPATTESNEEDRTLHQTFNCSDGGFAESTNSEYYSRKNPQWPTPLIVELSFDNCQRGDSVYHGQVRSGRFEAQGIRTPEFVVSRNGVETLRFSGAGIRRYPPYDGLQFSYFDNKWDMIDASIRANWEDGVLNVTNANSSYGNGFRQNLSLHFRARLSGGFTVESPVTAGHKITVSVPEEFVFVSPRQEYGSTSADWEFFEGRMLLQADDDSTLELNADLGDMPESPENQGKVRVILSNSEGVAETLAPWSQWQDHLEFQTRRTAQPDPDPVQETPDPAVPSVINRNNSVEILSQIFKIYVGDTYNKPLLEPDLFSDDGATLVSTQRVKDYVLQEFICNNNASLSFVTNTVSTAGAVRYYQQDYDNCRLGNKVYQGLADFRSDLGTSMASSDLVLTETATNRKIRYSGWTKRNLSFTRSDDYQMWRTRDMMLHRERTSDSLQDELELTHVTTAFARGGIGGGGVFEMQLGGKFSVRAAWTAGHAIHARTLKEFRSRVDLQLDPDAQLLAGFAGRLSLMADDGSQLMLEADNGNSNTVLVTIIDHLGTDETTHDWSLWGDDLRFN